MEEWYINKYYLLVRRIPGLSMSLDEFFNTPTIHINQLYNNEIKLIEEEERQRKEAEKGHKIRRPDHKDDSQELVDFFESGEIEV